MSPRAYMLAPVRNVVMLTAAILFGVAIGGIAAHFAHTRAFEALLETHTFCPIPKPPRTRV